MVEQVADPAAQQLLAGIISPRSIDSKSKETPETACTIPPRVTHFTRPLSSDASPSAGFSFGKAPQVQTNFSRRVIPKTNAVPQQDTSSPLKRAAIDEEPASTRSQQQPSQFITPTITRPTIATAVIAEQSGKTALSTSTSVTQRQSPPTVFGAPNPSNQHPEELTTVEGTSQSTASHHPTIIVEQDRARPLTKSPHGGDIVRSIKKTAVTPGKYSQASAQRFSVGVRRQSSSSPGRNQISSENLLKIVLHRQQEQKNLENELLQELRVKDNHISQLLQSENACRADFDSAKDHIMVLEFDLTKNTDFVARLKEKAKKLQDFVKGLSHDHETLKEDMRTLMGSAQDVKIQKADLIAALSETRASVETLNDHRKDSLLKAFHQLDLVNRALRDKEQQCDELTKLLASERDHMKSFEEEMRAEGERSRNGLDAAYRLHIDSLREEQSKLRDDLNQREHALKLAGEAKDQLNVTLGRSSSELKGLEKESEALRATARERLENIDQMKEQYSQLRDKVHDNEQELEYTRIRYDNMVNNACCLNERRADALLGRTMQDPQWARQRARPRKVYY